MPSFKNDLRLLAPATVSWYLLYLPGKEKINIEQRLFLYLKQLPFELESPWGPKAIVESIGCTSGRLTSWQFLNQFILKWRQIRTLETTAALGLCLPQHWRPCGLSGLCFIASYFLITVWLNFSLPHSPLESPLPTHCRHLNSVPPLAPAPVPPPPGSLPCSLSRKEPFLLN